MLIVDYSQCLLLSFSRLGCVCRDDTGVRMEIAELPAAAHPFYFGTQYHPEVGHMAAASALSFVIAVIERYNALSFFYLDAF